MVIARIAGIAAAVAAVGCVAYAVQEAFDVDAHDPSGIAADVMRRYSGSDGIVTLPGEARDYVDNPDSATGITIRSHEALFTAADRFGTKDRPGFGDDRVTFDEVRTLAASFDTNDRTGLDGEEWTSFNGSYREWGNWE